MDRNYRHYRHGEDENSRCHLCRPQECLQGQILGMITPYYGRDRFKPNYRGNDDTTYIADNVLASGELMGSGPLGEWNRIGPCTSLITMKAEFPGPIISLMHFSAQSSEVTIAVGSHARDFAGEERVQPSFVEVTRRAIKRKELRLCLHREVFSAELCTSNYLCRSRASDGPNPPPCVLENPERADIVYNMRQTIIALLIGLLRIRYLMHTTQRR